MSEYPTTREIIELRTLATSGKAMPVIDYLDEVYNLDCGKIIYNNTKHSWTLIIITGGWSGNEDIINTLSETMFWMLHWQKSERGGRYTFKGDIPKGKGSA